MMTRFRNLALAVLMAGTAAACSSSSSGGTPPPGSGSGSPATGNSVSISNFHFTPPSLTVKVGTKVTFTNDDSTVHTAGASDDPVIHSGNLSKGQTYTVTFNKAGTYDYVCDIHNYMHGTIIVQ
jgi:plastocyanin